MDAETRDGWPGLTDSYWRLGTKEMPVAYLVNLLLRVVPSAMRRSLLVPFGIDATEPGLATLTLKTPQDAVFIRPDVHMESESSRVFVALKVDAMPTLEDIKKYVLLHATLDEAGPPKRPYLILLVERASVHLEDVDVTFPHGRASTAIPDLLEKHPLGPELSSHASEAVLEHYAKMIRQVHFGSTTWAAVAATIAGEVQRRRGAHPELHEMLKVIAGDLIADFERRRL
jgi:hypothetical protein